MLVRVIEFGIDFTIWSFASKRGWFFWVVVWLSVLVTPLAILALPLLWLIPP